MSQLWGYSKKPENWKEVLKELNGERSTDKPKPTLIKPVRPVSVNPPKVNLPKNASPGDDATSSYL